MYITNMYIDPTYMVRSVSANANDSVYCSALAEHAVHSVMASFTGFPTVRLSERYGPIQAITRSAKRVNPQGRWFGRMLFTIGQPRLRPDGFASPKNARSGGDMSSLSTQVTVAKLRTPGSIIKRLDTVNLSTTSPSKNNQNPINSKPAVEGRGLFMKPDAWIAQTFQYNSVGDTAPRTYFQLRRGGPREPIHFDPKEPGVCAAMLIVVDCALACALA
jgi:hypothetical protein